MGNHYRTLVVPDVGPEEAEELAGRGLGWLVAAGIVRAERVRDCVFFAEYGHLPGPGWARAVADPRRGSGGGVAVHAGRTVFHGCPFFCAHAVCPHCEARTRFFDDEGEAVEGAFDSFAASIGVWQRTGTATAACDTCGRATELTAWTWDQNFFAFAHLGFAFWDWPALAPDFLADFASALGGHRFVQVRGNL
ncbi:hypothetical protein ABZ135_30395 [Streptomyces sp. NPDC006339]|uniref:hypothetical protein n=1 Tax=Streptomyces sp. NPDC006339 TaxID=3156755 RepID=UPI0033BA766D